MRNRILLSVLALALAAQQLSAQQPAQADSIAVAPAAPMADYNNPKPYILRDVKVHGVKYFNPEMLASSTGLVRGDTLYLPSTYLSQAITSIWNQRYYSDVEVIATPQGDSVNIDLYVSERPRVYKWTFEGVRKGQITELTEQTKIKRGDEYSEYLINRNVLIIKKFFRDKGFLNTEVDVKVANDTVITNGVDITFTIDKQSKVRVGKIDFEGNEAFKDGKLRATFKKTHRVSPLFWQNFKLKEADYETDKENLIDYYNSKGYRNAMIVKDSIYTISDNRLGIKIDVDEGNKYYFRNISWVGNSVYPTEQLEQMLALEPGDTYDKKAMQKRLGIGKEANPEEYSVSSLYQNNGYLFFMIEPAETIVGADSIDLEIKVFEGKQATINEVNITGNMRVDDEVIRRELYVRPGELYNRSLLMSTIRQLSQMGHFNPEALYNPGINPISGELVDISFPLEEMASDKFEVSGGWGAGMFVGSVGVELNNLSLRNFFGKKAWRPYPQGQNQQLKIRAQSNGTYYKSFMVSFTEPWLGGKKPTSLTVSTFYSDETNAYFMLQSGTKHFRTLGASVGIGRRLKWPDPYFTIYNELTYQSYNLKDWDYFILNNGSANTLAIKTVFARSTVDQPIYPRSGSDFSLSVTLTPPYSLFDGKDYSDPTMSASSRYKWIEYHKWHLKAQWFFGLDRPPHKLVMMAKAEMGYLGAYNKNKPSPFEGYDVGGDGMSGYNVYGVDVIGMRGYENSALTPYSSTGDYARAYNKYTLEMRYPFILKPQSQIYGLVFAEGGNAFASWKDFNPFQIKRALGAGVRLYLPVVGMIGVDFGYGFDKPVGSTTRSGWQPHFMIGTQF